MSALAGNETEVGTASQLMKAAAIVGPRQGAIENMPRPQISGDQALVNIVIAPLCTEFKQFQTGGRRVAPGHEAAGEVVDVTHRGRVRVGDRVVVMPGGSCGQCSCCNSGEYIFCDNLKFGQGTLAQYIAQSDRLLLPIPDDLSYEHASMACCGLGPSFGAMERLAVDRFDTLLLTGLGPVGLGAVINAKYRGARVFAVESHPYRVALARDLGADVVLDPLDPEVLQQILSLTGGKGVDKAIELSGANAAQRLCIDATRRRGAVAFVAESTNDLNIRVSPDMIRKGLKMLGSWHFSISDAAKIMRVIRDSASQLDKLITHTFPLSQIQDAWELQSTGACGKVLVRPREVA